MTDPAFFRIAPGLDAEILTPQPLSASGWGEGSMRGMPIGGALARATERTAIDAGAFGLIPARFTLDLFRPARQVPTMVSANIVRQGRRLCLIDATFQQSGREVARSSTLLLRPGASPQGAVWSANRTPAPPSRLLRPDGSEQRLYFTEEAGWSQASTTGPSAGRKQSWHFGMPIVENEPLSAFQMAASIADVANVVSNWGTDGLEFINADVTLALAREPVEMEFGLSALERVESGGISVGTALLHDRAGVFGTTTVLALANASRRVDPRTRERAAEPTTQRSD